MDNPEKNERNKLLESIKAIYQKALVTGKNVLDNEEGGINIDKLIPPPPGFPHAIRQRRRAKNRVARASRKYNRLRAKGACV